MSTEVQPLGIRLFMEGVEVPVISASVSVQPNMPATAAIQIIPTDMGLYFLPRTLVHLFYLDTYLSDEEREEAQKIVDKTGKSRAAVNVDQGGFNNGLNELHDYAYKLLFCGEVIGFDYKKTPLGRQLVLHCMDLSTYWDTCYQFFADYSANGNALTDRHHHFVGSREGMFDNFGGHQWVMSRLLQTRPRSPEYQECEGLLGGLISLLEAVGGLRYRSSKFKGHNGVNDFFTIAELRYGLLSMLGAIQADKTSARLYSAKAFNSWLRNGMTNLGTLISFRDMLNQINQYIFHEIHPNPCAHFVRGGTTKHKRTVKVGKENLVDATVQSVWKAEMKKALGIINAVKEDLDYIIYLFQRMTGESGGDAKSFASGHRVKDNEFRLRDADDILAQIIPIIEGSSGASKKIASSLREIRSKVSEAIDKLPIIEDKKITDVSSGSYGGKSRRRIEKAVSLLKGASDDLSNLLNKERNKYETRTIEVPEASFLYNQLFLPNAFFVSPPRCNIIFPDQYYDLSFSRNFMREVSRLACQAGLSSILRGGRGAGLFTSYYLAPNIKDVRGQVLRASLSEGTKVLLPHEVHSGIIPKFDWVSDGHRWGMKAANSARSVDSVQKSRKIHYLQRLADYQFYLHRWSARQLRISGVFNPNIVAGLPSVVMDRSAPSPAVLEQLEKVLGRRMLPTQFVAKVHSYTHSINQDGGNTAVHFAFARTHRGLDDEFLGTLAREVERKRKSRTISVDVRKLLTEPNRLKHDFFLVATDEKGQTDFDQLKESHEMSKRLVRLYAEKKLKPNTMVSGLGRVGKVKEEGGDIFIIERIASLLGISSTVFDDSKNIYMKTRAFLGMAASTNDANYNKAEETIKLPEKLTVEFVSIRKKVTYDQSGVAFEDAVRPGWFSEDIWTNANISEKVYLPLLGTTALTDDKGFSQEQQDELLKRWKEDQLRRTNPNERRSASETESLDNKFKYPVVPGSVEESIDGLSLVYGMVKDMQVDVHQFIREVTRRPIANLVEVLGSQNLEFDESGKVRDPDSMLEGFHSRAYGDYNTDVQLPDKEGSSTKVGARALGALMDGVPDPSQVRRKGLIDDGPPSGIHPAMDPRGRARARVKAYVAELQVSRGLLGS